MDSTSEAQLVYQVSQGDQTAYQCLLDSHLAPITRYVQRMTGSLSDSEDIVQEVFLRLWLQAGKYDPAKAGLTTWLHNIAHNLCIDVFRKQSRVNLTAEFDETPGGDEPETAMSEKSVATQVSKALAGLPERQRSALILSYYQGLSNSETAHILDLSVTALESLMARARRGLKQALECDDEFDQI